MKYLILSDIHANKEAFAAVLAHVKRKPWDKVVFLGDLVGYGANPNHAVNMMRGLRRPFVGIRGNHDKVCAGIEEGEMFNRIALHAAMWTRRKLTTSNLKWLRALPQGPMLVDGAFGNGTSSGASRLGVTPEVVHTEPALIVARFVPGGTLRPEHIHQPATLAKIGTPSTSVPAFFGLVPATTCVPYSRLRLP